ncbi:MAG: type II toxin-antitoxin system HicA family toxin [Bacteroidales bacterium]|nr:type II toxin-antitoxin system HicA family toxin [Bacteroidales bacterium]MBD5386747.1 type II toxin-antitoxin system HicA family toxin [bacterium]
MKVSELVRILVKSGCYIHRRGGNHDIWKSPITGKTCPVSRHQTEELKPKTLASIKEKLGI